VQYANGCILSVSDHLIEAAPATFSAWEGDYQGRITEIIRPGDYTTGIIRPRPKHFTLLPLALCIHLDHIEMHREGVASLLNANGCA
ncbi:hypothetical protein AVEN_70314-1, partial [Araneus ventricosus]